MISRGWGRRTSATCGRGSNVSIGSRPGTAFELRSRRRPVPTGEPAGHGRVMVPPAGFDTDGNRSDLRVLNGRLVIEQLTRLEV